MGRRRRDGRETLDVETSAAIDRFLSSPASRTRRGARTAPTSATSPAGSAAQGLSLEDLDVRVLAAYTRSSGARGAGSRRPRSDAGSPPSARSSATPSGRRAFPDAALAPRRPRRLPETPALAEVEDAVDAASGATTARSRFGTRRSSSSSTPAASARPRRSHSTSATSTSTASSFTCAARASKERLVPLGEEAAWRLGLWLRDGRPRSRAAPATRCSSRCGGGVSTRASSDDCSPTLTASGTRTRRTSSREAPTCARSRSSSATRRSRRRRSTATSTRGGCGACTTTRTRGRSGPSRRSQRPISVKAYVCHLRADLSTDSDRSIHAMRSCRRPRWAGPTACSRDHPVTIRVWRAVDELARSRCSPGLTRIGL